VPALGRQGVDLGGGGGAGRGGSGRSLARIARSVRMRGDSGSRSLRTIASSAVISAAVSSSVGSSCVLATYGGGQRSRLRQAVDSYMTRGRRFDGLDDEALQHHFVMVHKAWCAYPYHPHTGCEVNDVDAECLARRREVPFELLIDELGAFLWGWHSPNGAPGSMSNSSDGHGAPWTTSRWSPSSSCWIMGKPVLFAPFLGAMLTPNGWLRGTLAARQNGASA